MRYKADLDPRCRLSGKHQPATMETCMTPRVDFPYQLVATRTFVRFEGVITLKGHYVAVSPPTCQFSHRVFVARGRVCLADGLM